ncbi:uncharacterized protein RHOBADRAFT_54379 [Rhodotorula graminis WP1]|uniref:Uncharacterized protein n=1 Tax=Rhodotorula graminis (strain WP1) TaxID=578459 RepID=A0A194S227_RHOGW|nr:uncharacterized protein RHOBADRAFT_54379 [Rhodotorula graminis WP1]KPV74580.1 hypothetical protein RHOBADRAFT_54379 [Rhodotorula graminis WP1]
MTQDALSSSYARPAPNSGLSTPRAPPVTCPVPPDTTSRATPASATCEPVASSSREADEACESSGERVSAYGGTVDDSAMIGRDSAGDDGQSERRDQAAGPSSSSAAVAAPPPPPPDKALDPTHHRPSAPRLHERNFGALGS